MIGTRVVLGTYRDRTVVLFKLQPRQIIILLVAAPLLLLGTSGWTERLMFASTSSTKYVMTVAIPLLVTAVMLARNRFLVFVSAAIIVSPAATLQMSFLGVSFPALATVCILAATPIFLGMTRPAGRSALGRAVPLASALALVPMARGNQLWSSISVALAAIAVAFLCARALRVRGGLVVVLCSFFASMFIQAALAIWEYQSRSEFDVHSGTVRSVSNYFFDFQSQPRPTGTFADPISLGSALVVGIPVGLAAMYILLQRKQWVAAGMAGAMVATVGLGLALSLSRMATLGGIAALVTVVVLVPRLARVRMAQMTGGLLLVLLAGAMAVGGASLVERASVSDPTASGVATADGDRDREYLWSIAYETGMEYPILGVGVGNLNARFLARSPQSGHYTHAHSVYLQVFSEAGLVGISALVVLVVGFCRDARRAKRRAPVMTAGLVGSVVALAVAAITDVVTIQQVSVAATIAPIFGLIAGLAGQDSDDRDQ